MKLTLTLDPAASRGDHRGFRSRMVSAAIGDAPPAERISQGGRVKAGAIVSQIEVAAVAALPNGARSFSDEGLNSKQGIGRKRK